MALMTLVAEGGILDSSVISFVTSAISDIIGLLVTPPLGIFLTISVLSVVVGLTSKIVRTVRRG